MDYNLIEEFKGILESSWKQEREDFIRDSREMGFNHELSEELNEDEDEDSRKEESSEDEEYETGDESPSTINLSDALDYDRVKRDLNQFRASHSLSDPEVDSELKNYFDRLSKDEKKILYVFPENCRFSLYLNSSLSRKTDCDDKKLANRLHGPMANSRNSKQMCLFEILILRFLVS